MKKRLTNIDRKKLSESFLSFKVWFSKFSFFILTNIILPFIPSAVAMMCKIIQGYNISITELISESSLILYSLSLSVLMAFFTLANVGTPNTKGWSLAHIITAAVVYTLNISLGDLYLFKVPILAVIFWFTCRSMRLNWAILRDTKSKLFSSASVREQ